ncbi:TetR/AcrR family transcriptional regulator [Sphaerisporangium fuscum]|uniref:TetR/AcrR family transcriptional regulator n=1 Tax=Sphaerisporangium fuscum TaxID=2835868 RepID=UPI001BDBF28A|nr:TetR/AcrR family transcriptional regulator [Sphaerisporangium fuscum]
MTGGRPERADAARNRRAILLATEDLLTRHRPDQISMEQVAAAAGVGKGTVFHRFGNRMGLMVAVMQERAFALNEAVRNGPPPLGPGAPPRERLLAFIDAVMDVIGRNKGLLAALGQAVTSTSPQEDAGEDDHPVYGLWHGHVSGLIAEIRPDLDSEVLAHLMLAGLHSRPILRLLERGETERLAGSLRAVATALLDSPPAS